MYHLPKTEGRLVDGVDPKDGFPTGETKIKKTEDGEDYSTTTDLKNDGETTTTDPNSGKDVNVPPSGAGC